VQTLLLRKNNEYYTTGVCAFVAFGFHYALRMRHTVICGLPCSTVFFPFSHKRHDFRKKVTEYKMCVSIFSTKFFETFPILRRNERDMIKMCVGLHVK
jgi:hypothetical protein